MSRPFLPDDQRRVPVTAHVLPGTLATLARRASLLGVTVSAAAAAVIERGLVDVAREEGGGGEAP